MFPLHALDPKVKLYGNFVCVVDYDGIDVVLDCTHTKGYPDSLTEPGEPESMVIEQVIVGRTVILSLCFYEQFENVLEELAMQEFQRRMEDGE